MATSAPIVLIDDNPAEATLLKEALKEVEGEYDLQQFEDAESALHFIEQHAKTMKLIICDINMPKMTGIELLRRLYENEELRLACIPFIFLSNSSNSEEIKEAYRL